MANLSIRITGISNGVLILSDNGTTNADPGDVITWSISPNSGVASITGIVDNSSVDLFSPDPAQVPGSSSWQGTINSAAVRGSSENYTINYTTSAKRTFSYDPKIQINPRQ